MSGLTIQFTGLKKQYNNLRTEILDTTDEVLRSGILIGGNHTAEFEAWLAKKNHSKYAIAVHSGTSALECIAEYYISSVQMPSPPRVLIPSLTYAATANAFIRAGWEVHFIDTDNYGLLDYRKIPDDMTYEAVVLVGLYGAGVVHLGVPRIWERWLLHETIVIEDGAQHWLGAQGRRVGKACAISFDPMKNLPCYGNGGAVVTNDTGLLTFARAWRDNGKSTHNEIGTNSKMSELDCALLMVKAKHIDAWQTRRSKIAEYWASRLRNTDIRSLTNKDNAHEHAFHKFVIDVDQRDILQKNLAIKKIETKIHYRQPLHEIGTFRQYPGPDILSCSSALSRRVLTLPFYPELTDLEVEYIIDSVIDCAS